MYMALCVMHGEDPSHRRRAPLLAGDHVGGSAAEPRAQHLPTLFLQAPALGITGVSPGGNKKGMTALWHCSRGSACLSPSTATPCRSRASCSRT